MNLDKSDASPIEEIRKLVKSDGERIDAATVFWDETESIVKRVEHINHEMIVPAISELRYAGRKLIDYLSALRAGLDDQTVNSHLDDFTQCCIRARHDAIDALVSYVIEYLENLEGEVGANVIQSLFPEYVSYKRNLKDAVNLIIASREERKKRNRLYSEINKQYVDEIVKAFDALELRKAEIFAAKARLDSRQNIVSWAVSLTSGVLIVVISLATIVLIKPV